MRVHIGTDHAALQMKNYIVELLTSLGHAVVDHGAVISDPDDDYPDFVIPCAQGVIADPGSLGIVLGGSGNGEQIAANKVPGIRAALAYTAETASLARQHNDANVVALGARMHTEQQGMEIVLAFLDTPFSGDERHRRRIQKISDYEQHR